MEIKILEVRDRLTFIPVLCVDMRPENGAQGYYLRRLGYAGNALAPNVLMTKADASGDRVWNDPYGWGDRTMQTAHLYILERWTTLKDGDVIDVEFILGESDRPKLSERITEMEPHA